MRNPPTRTPTVVIDGVEHYGLLVGDRLQLYRVTASGGERVKGKAYPDAVIAYLAALKRLPS